MLDFITSALRLEPALATLLIRRLKTSSINMIDILISDADGGVYKVFARKLGSVRTPDQNVFGSTASLPKRGQAVGITNNDINSTYGCHCDCRHLLSEASLLSNTYMSTNTEMVELKTLLFRFLSNLTV